MLFRYIFFAVLFVVFVVSCNNDTSNGKVEPNVDDSSSSPIYKVADNTNVEFNNFIEENLSLNVITNDAMLHGGGVGILDINNDGLQDIYFAGNMVSDRLYLNDGGLSFTDISESSGISKSKNWSSGVAVADVNNDGYQDLYVCKFIYDEPGRKENLLYINNKDNTFTEMGKSYGVNDDGYSVMANFLDYDMDGDLDLYVANQPPYRKDLKKKVTPTSYEYTDRLYRNDGDKFTDVTEKSGVKNMCYSLSATMLDYNNDGLPDIYVACDYEEPDLLYENQGDGTFKNVAYSSIGHMSNFSMGADVADINNDGYLDLFTADMVADDNFRNKTNMASMAVEKFWSMVNGGYHYQYMFNTLQLNNGNGTFSEIAQMAGVSKTDWSWAALFIDADQDGNKDLFVTNGILMEIRNKDFMNNMKSFIKKKKDEANGDAVFDPLELTKMAPQIKIKNRAYRNTGNLTFENKTDVWGFDKEGWSQGMAYADLDNDGDLDIVVSNMNEKADIFENTINSKTNSNYISVAVDGVPGNTFGIGSRVQITLNDDSKRISDITPYRGYMSSCQSIAHFGLGSDNKVKKVEIIFPNGRVYAKENVRTNQLLKVEYQSDLPKYERDEKPAIFFKSVPNPNITYLDNDFDDYKREVLIPYKMSSLGPFTAAGDINNDGKDDFYIGGAIGTPGQLYTQIDENRFRKLEQTAFIEDRKYEDGGVLFFDSDDDGDLDLYVASGGNEYKDGSKGYQDRLYLNDGKGIFSKSKALPNINVSSSVVKASDIDGDGDLDLFVGGRQTPGKYGVDVSSYLLRNDDGNFVDITKSVAEILDGIGMITGAEWADIDGDNQDELIIAGEWMPITVLSWDGSKLTKNEKLSINDSDGLWNTLQVHDLDEDGDMDLIAGNYGLNYKYKASNDAPLELYVKDFDDNGTSDVYLGYHDDGDGELYPVRGKQCSSEQMPFVKDKYGTYNEFGKATVIDVLDGRLDGSTIKRANSIANTIFINDGNGGFTQKLMPMRAQSAPVYSMVVKDYNGDGHKDILCVGNFYNREIETTRSDAGVGYLLLGDGKGDYTVMNPAQTGMRAILDARSLLDLKNNDGSSTIAIANNGGPMQFFKTVN